MSLRTRLTLWFCGVLAVALALFGVLVYTLVSSQLHSDVDVSVETKARDTAFSVRMPNGKLTIPTNIRVPQSQFRTPTLYTEVRDTTGAVIFRSNTLQGSDLPISADVLVNAKDGLPVFETVAQDGQDIRLYTTAIFLSGRLVGFVQVGRNLADIDVALRQLRSWLLLSSIVVLLGAAIGGWLLAHATLRPLGRISKAAEAIGLARRLDQRLTVPDVNDEIGRLASTFNEMLDRLEAVFLAQQRFVADASHELRTPLTTIQGNVDFLRRNPGLPSDERAEALDDVASEAARMGRLTNGLLALARADAGRHLDREPTELRPIIERCFHQAQALARPTEVSIQLIVNRLEPGARVQANADRLEEMLMILLDNAFRYNQPGGIVRLVAVTSVGIHRIEVSDTGRGITAEDLPHIFERFYRSPHSRSEDGTGLGLAIARWIASEHESEIGVASVLDHGTTFTVALAALDPAPLVLVS
ncbi:MAG TPA: HAMP domain-containing sensor histidine kinase [Chloroflexota bacterium]|nr:HAMP domain-containing sensor histidine kinase [Chloroflexota bacterium]